ncbi:hypothetical protein OG244_08975 [Streptomyces brevispora]|nr:3'-5' exonuclease [Streptomyces brevispora]
MGQVYLGESPAGRLVAVKVIKPSVLDEDSRARFPLEVDSLKAVYGPFIASFVAADTHAERPWPAVEFVQGADLLVHVSEHGPLPLVEAASLGALLAEGLGTVHDATNDMADEVVARLARRGIMAAKITGDGERGAEGVHVGTMYRFKGLEYRCMIIAGVSEGLVPRAAVKSWERTDRLRHRRELRRARSLPFVAATRARDALTISWHGEPSRFLGPPGAWDR